MASQSYDEILERLEVLEGRLEQALSRPRRRRGPRHPGGPGNDRVGAGPPSPVSCGQPFEEQRVVDLIVRLVSERVEEIVQAEVDRVLQALPDLAETGEQTP